MQCAAILIIPRGVTAVPCIVSGCPLARYNTRSATLLGIRRSHEIGAGWIVNRQRKISNKPTVTLRCLAEEFQPINGQDHQAQSKWVTSMHPLDRRPYLCNHDSLR